MSRPYMNDDRVIVIRRTNEGSAVFNGVLWAEGLTPDETLWTIAQLLNDKPARYLKTNEQEGAWRRSLAEPHHAGFEVKP